MNSQFTKEQIKAAMDTVRTLADTIRSLGSVPSGVLYSQCMPHMDLPTYQKAIGMLKGAGLVREEYHVLFWIAAKAEPKPLQHAEAV